MALQDTIGFAKENPELAFLQASAIAEQTGTDIKTAAASETFANRKSVLGEQRLRDLSAPVEPLTETPREGEVEDILSPVAGARTDLFRESDLIASRKEELDVADEKLIRDRILLDREPTADIDARIKELMKQKFVSKALLNDELKHLSPSQRRAAVANRLRVFGTTVDNLLEIRGKRLKQIDREVNDEVTSLRKQHDALETRMGMIENMQDELEQIGADREAMAFMQLTADKARAEIQRIRRQMQKSGVSSSAKMDDDEVDSTAQDILSRLGDDVDDSFLLKDEFDLLKLSSEERRRVKSRLRELQREERQIVPNPGDEDFVGPLLPRQESFDF